MCIYMYLSAFRCHSLFVQFTEGMAKGKKKAVVKKKGKGKAGQVVEVHQGGMLITAVLHVYAIHVHIILGECLAFLASGPTCLLGACQMPSDDVKETLCHFRWSSSAPRYIYLFTRVHSRSTATDESLPFEP